PPDRRIPEPDEETWSFASPPCYADKHASRRQHRLDFYRAGHSRCPVCHSFNERPNCCSSRFLSGPLNATEIRGHSMQIAWHKFPKLPRQFGWTLQWVPSHLVICIRGTSQSSRMKMRVMSLNGI